METLSHWIGGARTRGTSDRYGDVFNPATGDVQARVPLASKADLDAAVAAAAAAQVAWGATNPQRRARVMMAFGALINAHMDELAELVSREHGKTLPDAKGDVQRGLEVVEVCMGAPALLKGEYTDSAGPGIDLYSMRQPLGVVAGITPFNFPAMIPLWKMAPAIACGNAMILKPSERCPSTALRLAELLQQAGLPDGVLQVVNGDKEVVDAILDNDTGAGRGLRRLHPDRAVHLCPRDRERQTRPVLWRREEPHDRDARRRPRQGRRRADRRGLWCGGRTLHGDLGRGAGGRRDGRCAGGTPDPADREVEGRPLYRGNDVDFGPLITRPRRTACWADRQGRGTGRASWWSMGAA
jgi:hypothetical protein